MELLFIVLCVVVLMIILIDGRPSKHPDQMNIIEPHKHESHDYESPCRYCKRHARIALRNMERWLCTDCGTTYVRKNK